MTLQQEFSNLTCLPLLSGTLLPYFEYRLPISSSSSYSLLSVFPATFSSFRREDLLYYGKALIMRYNCALDPSVDLHIYQMVNKTLTKRVFRLFSKDLLLSVFGLCSTCFEFLFQRHGLFIQHKIRDQPIVQIYIE